MPSTPTNSFLSVDSSKFKEINRQKQNCRGTSRAFRRSLLFLFLLCASIVCAEKALRVERVIDGDTLKLSNGQHVRLIGVDTPETRKNPKAVRDSERTQTDLETINRMGREAKQFVKTMVEGKEVELRYDVNKRDRYGRLLAYVFVSVPASSGIQVQDGLVVDPGRTTLPVEEKINATEKPKPILVNLNAYLVQTGYAAPLTVPPNVKYADLFQKLYRQAREQKRGLWHEYSIK